VVNEGATDNERPLESQRELSLLSLLELSNELNLLRDLYEIVDVALFNMMGHFGSARAALWVMPEDSSQEAVLLRSQGIPDAIARGVGAVWSRWLSANPDALSAPVLIDELASAGLPGLDLARQSDIQLLAPIAARRRLVGFIALGKRVGGSAFLKLDREVLEASLNLLGTAMENTNVYNRSIENNRRLRLANEKLQELDRLKSEFFRNLNHELRTPLTVMHAYLDSLIGGEEPQSQRREHLSVVREQAVKLSGMILNLLDYSKLMDEKSKISTARQDAVAVVREYYEQRRPGITADLRELRFSAASGVPFALFERGRLLQIVDCLVDNAIKFTAQGAVIHLRIEADTDGAADWVRIDVEDDGPGIPPDRVAFVFDSFRQGDGSATRVQGGMGLGLAVARQLAEKMDGRLDVRSEMGRGTVFSLRMPAG
jgi:signal transduction histidine kinase